MAKPSDRKAALAQQVETLCAGFKRSIGFQPMWDHGQDAHATLSTPSCPIGKAAGEQVGMLRRSVYIQLALVYVFNLFDIDGYPPS